MRKRGVHFAEKGGTFCGFNILKFVEPKRVRPHFKTSIVLIVLIDLIEREKRKRAKAHLFPLFLRASRVEVRHHPEPITGTNP